MNSIDKYQSMLRVDDRPSAGMVTTSIELVNEMFDRLPVSVFESTSSKFCDPCFGNGTFIIELIKRLRKYGHSMSNIQSRIYGCEIDIGYYNGVNGRKGKLSNYDFNNLYHGDALEYNFNNMKFDVVIGNPPYQENNTTGNQQKLYNSMCKRAFELSSGVVSMVTPTSVVKKNKRFTLVGKRGVKYVDFVSSDYFNVGVSICSWMVCDKYRGDTTIVDKNGERNIDINNTPIVDTSIVSEQFAILYNKLKEVTKRPVDRMFKQNPIDSNNGKSNEQSDEFKYPVYKLNKGEVVFVAYYKPLPKGHSCVKFTVSITKTLNDDAIYVGEEDFTAFHVSVPIESPSQVENIKSFITSDYFLQHSKNWKLMDGYGFNNCLVHLPPFDKNIKWDNDSVEEFFMSFVAR